MAQHDVVIIGGGAAGLAAGLQLGRVRRSAVVIDSGAPRNAPAAHLHSYLGRDGLPPAQLLADGRDEVARYGGEVRAGEVVSVEGDVMHGFTVSLADGSRLRGRRLIIATGITDVLPDLPGIAEQWGRGVIHCPFCHGWEVRDQRIVVLDTNGMGAHQALLFRQLTDDVTVVVHAGPGPDPAAADDLEVLGVPIVRSVADRVDVGEDGSVTGLRLVDGTVRPAGVIVVGPRFLPNLGPLAALGIEVVAHPSGLGQVVAADATGATNVAGVYAVGNLTDPSQQLLQAAAQGSRTAGLLSLDLVHDDIARVRRSRGDAQSWDARYGEHAGMWSGAPNGSLVVEVEDMAPGRALDVGCGEGGDAIWLAQRGWRVTAVDISDVAVERGRRAAEAAGVEVEWRCDDLLEAPPESQSYDLVSIQYPALLATAGAGAVQRLFDAVAPGGTLLAVGHDLADHHHAKERGFDPADYIGVDAMAALLPADFEVEVQATRTRPNPPPGTPHVDDVILRARRFP